MKKSQVCWLAGTMGLAAPASAAEGDAAMLHAELDAICSEYETRIDRLEARIRELEARDGPEAAAPRPTRKKAAPPEPPPPAEAAPDPAAEAKAWRKRAGDQFRKDTETRDLSKAAEESALDERIEEILEGYLDITGYFRAGYGRSDSGEVQHAFGIPGVAKYRLGNEAENYGELAFSKTFFGDHAFAAGAENDGPLAQMNLRLAFFNPYDNYGTGDNTDVTVPEMWASVANVIAAAPGAKIWAGSRFYRRHDIHINDFYFWDMSGGGGGIEDIPIGIGKFAVAWLGDGAESAIYSNLGDPDPDNPAGFSKSSFDFRWYDWKLLGGDGELGLVFAQSDSGRDATGDKAPDAQGFALSLARTRRDFHDKESLHKTSLQIGNGPAKTFNSGFETFATPAGTFIRPDPEESWRFRATDQFVFKPADHLALGTALVYQYTDFDQDNIAQHWLSAGVRPVWFLSEHFNIALETGVDWTSDSLGGENGTLGKITLAPEVSLGDEFMSRPVIRAFVTYAQWTDSLRGSVGGTGYADADSGFTWGMQMESWW